MATTESADLPPVPHPSYAACWQSGSLTELLFLIDHLHKKLQRLQERSMREAGLSPQQYLVLMFLWEKDGLPFKDLADASFCTRATMTGIVDTLEKKGLVTRQPNPTDRRSLLVTLTSAGKQLQGSAPSLESIFQGCCDILNGVETQQLTSLLHKLDQNLPF